ncbi:hypothetical protein ASE90_11050 [Sphingomonas sp. Leaf67]|nr:hypothetical protein ASE90_11050 [Sphingomonas sp. Leaf67]
MHFAPSIPPTSVSLSIAPSIHSIAVFSFLALARLLEPFALLITIDFQRLPFLSKRLFAGGQITPCRMVSLLSFLD